MSEPNQFDTPRLSALFDVEHRIRRAETLKALRYVAVNESRQVVDYQQAAMVERAGPNGWRVTALANVPSVDRNSLYVQWVEHVMCRYLPDSIEPCVLKPQGMDDWTLDTWREVCPGEVLLVPLEMREGTRAWLLLAREARWQAAPMNLAAHLGEVLGHALHAFLETRKRRQLRNWLSSSRLWWGALVLLLLILCLPVRLSALAPAELVAKAPRVVSAPMDGVVDRVLVEPNAQVVPGQPLVKLQDIEAKARFKVADQALNVAQARFEQARQEAFGDAKSRASMVALSAERDLREVQRSYAETQLDQVVLKAESAGLAIFDDPNDWAGRPVRTGERIMQLANPAERKVSIELPVEDALVLSQGAPVTLFLDSRPLSPIEGEVERVSYKPVVNGRDQLVYHVSATLNESPDFLRIGLRGTARVSGDRVSLAYYLFRRPLAGLRQALGV
ncbi:HlyD family efflux transporter periplasmic adaptor subunit [Cobetia sp. 4B]|uniref:efflux RND transporter periplasmic adaptor subunit n=1 Tax=Cobetia sp. 4B TaxID=2758724 RepID=UPI001C045DAD|nr:HlyD family efflux transporter periplasmic adaptor subunit [Cobetia sp. 4B]QWN35867.1 HlyD family efflux transporter periplasmic adaptor subunit [Cobetia sp. 4B]